MKQKSFYSASDRRWQKRYQRIQRRKDEEAARQDGEASYQFKCGIASSEFEDQLAIYRMMAEEERSAREIKRCIEEMSESFRRYFNERTWQELSRATAEFRDGLQSASLFVDEFVESLAQDEELGDFEAGETGSLDEFLNSFQ